MIEEGQYGSYDDFVDDVIQQIEELRDAILVHSYVYYELNTNIISDYEYDMMCKELAIMQNAFPQIASECAWHEYFHDFDGSTGYHLPKNIPYIIRLAEEWLNDEQD